MPELSKNALGLPIKTKSVLETLFENLPNSTKQIDTLSNELLDCYLKLQTRAELLRECLLYEPRLPKRLADKIKANLEGE